MPVFREVNVFQLPSRPQAAVQALFVTFLWSTSWIFIKVGLDEIPALTFAGLRYIMAALVLLPFLLRNGDVEALGRLGRRQWARLVSLGLVFYALTQGAQFLALSYLPAQTTSLLLSFSPVVVATLGIVFLAERTVAAQWFGVVLYLIGAAIYFYPADIPSGQHLGMAIAVVGVLSNAGSALLGRAVNRATDLRPLTVTVVSTGIGAVALLVSGIATQGLPKLGVTEWAIIAWLAVVNTALAFTLWNLTQRTLSAMESSMINQTMLLQIAVLSWIFLDESLGWKSITGLGLAALGVLIVQLRSPSRQ